MANQPGNQDLGDLSFTPAEAAAIAQAETRAPVAPPLIRIRWWGVALVLLIVMVCGGLLPFFYEQKAQRTEARLTFQGRHNGATVAIVRKDVQLRQEPRITSASLGVLAVGTTLLVLETRADGFHRVRGGSQTGYVAAAYLIVISGVTMGTPTEGRVREITGTAQLREQPSLTGPVVTALSAATPITILGYTHQGWVLVTAQSDTGFLWSGLLEPSPAIPSQSKWARPSARTASD